MTSNTGTAPQQRERAAREPMQTRGACPVDLTFRGRHLTSDRPLVMAIVNRTRDSFYDRGATFALPAAHEAIDKAAAEAADVVDIGGVTASPGSEVGTAEEIHRVVPLVEYTRANHPELLISVDTWRAEVGEAACQAGAHVLNDAWAAADPEILDVAAAHGAGYIAAHTGGRAPRAVPFRPCYEDLVGTMRDAVLALAARAEAAGVPREGIVIDGTGYGKNTTDHLQLLAHTGEFVATGWPVLMALSNKTFVGETLAVGMEDRLYGTLAATAVAAYQGAAIFRAHQVAPTRQALEMVAAIGGSRAPAATGEWIA
jgi:dihydropteroate synthase